MSKLLDLWLVMYIHGKIYDTILILVNKFRLTYSYISNCWYILSNYQTLKLSNSRTYFISSSLSLSQTIPSNLIL